jgi:hypothetical protein
MCVLEECPLVAFIYVWACAFDVCSTLIEDGVLLEENGIVFTEHVRDVAQELSRICETNAQNISDEESLAGGILVLLLRDHVECDHERNCL